MKLATGKETEPRLGLGGPPRFTCDGSQSKQPWALGQKFWPLCSQACLLFFGTDFLMMLSQELDLNGCSYLISSGTASFYIVICHSAAGLKGRGSLSLTLSVYLSLSLSLFSQSTSSACVAQSRHLELFTKMLTKSTLIQNIYHSLLTSDLWMHSNLTTVLQIAFTVLPLCLWRIMRHRSPQHVWYWQFLNPNCGYLRDVLRFPVCEFIY